MGEIIQFPTKEEVGLIKRVFACGLISVVLSGFLAVGAFALRFVISCINELGTSINNFDILIICIGILLSLAMIVFAIGEMSWFFSFFFLRQEK